MTRSVRRLARLALSAAVLATVLTGCGRDSEPPSPEEGKPREPIPMRIGTLPTEDALPLWVAEQRGLFAEAGLPKVEITTFQSAQERDAALAAGAIDAFMGDIIAAAALYQSGTKVTIATVMLGATPAEGRFGIVAPKTWNDGTGADALARLANVPVATSSGTIQEYVLDGLMRQSGVPTDQVKVEEVKKVPVRFELLMSGKLKAAALPEPLLTLAEKQGAILLADDTTPVRSDRPVENISQTVLVVSNAFQRKPGGLETLEELLGAWDEAVGIVNADPNAWRGLLVEKARLPEPLATTYEVETYPKHQLPTAEQVNAVLEWMRAKGLLKTPLTYGDLTVVMP